MIFLKRWIFALLLVAVTWNPTPWNYISWGFAHQQTQLPLIVLGGLLLLIGYIIYLRATLRSIGLFGVFLVLALGAAILWVLQDFGLVNFSDPRLTAWLVILGTSLVLGLGMSWSHIRRSMSGQLDVDDVDE